MKRKITAFLLALTAITSAFPATYAAEAERTANVRITTEINGQGVVTTYDGDKLTTDTYSSIKSALDQMQKPDTDKEESDRGKDESDKDTNKSESIQPETNVTTAESAIYESYFFQLIKKFVIQCMDEYHKDNSITANPSPKPSSNHKPAQTDEIESTDETESTDIKD